MSAAATPGRKRQVWWLGAAEKCDICEKPFPEKVGTKIVDGRTRGGPWALMDMACHKKHGVGSGTGHGQVYERQAATPEAIKNGHIWLKIEG